MESPLWIDKHAPKIEDFVQEELSSILSLFEEIPINFLFYGPEGCGKTAAAIALSQKIDENFPIELVELNVSDLFEKSKKDIIENPLFSGFLSSGKTPKGSKESLIIHLIKESAGYSPVSGGNKIMLLDNFESAQKSFQQALRRIIERHHQNTKFILTTRELGKVIPAIRSRCYPVPVRAPNGMEMKQIIENILTTEGVEYSIECVEFITVHAEGNIRIAILYTQAIAERFGNVNQKNAYEILNDIGKEKPIIELIEYAKKRNFSETRSALESLLIKEGYTGSKLLECINNSVKKRGIVEPMEFAELVGEVDFHLAKGSNALIHLTNLLTKIGHMR
tara:strand:- start:1022 stop:2029 length:1008 start_codon:yes stop_codon:yes gene_type:complete